MAKSKVKGLRIRINTDAARQILTSKEVATDLQKRAERIADQAGGSEAGFEAMQTGGAARARSIVVTTTRAARREEAEDRKLTRALDAGR